MIASTEILDEGKNSGKQNGWPNILTINKNIRFKTSKQMFQNMKHTKSLIFHFFY